MGKRVVLATFGSLGDLHPFIAVAKALQRRGAEPVLAGAGLYREKVEAEGIAFCEVRPSEEMLADNGLTVGDFATLIGKSPYLLIDRAITPYLEDTYADLCEVMQGADLAVISSFAFAARIAAEKLGFPRRWCSWRLVPSSLPRTLPISSSCPGCPGSGSSSAPARRGPCSTWVGCSRAPLRVRFRTSGVAWAFPCGPVTRSWTGR